MREEIDNIIKQKNYRDLSGDELRLLEKEGISKEEFIALKLLFQQMEVDKIERLEKLAPVKSKLDQMFEEKHGKPKILLWKSNTAFYAQPLLQVAAVVVFIVLLFNQVDFSSNKQMAFENTSEMMKENISKNQAIKDSINTLYKEKKREEVAKDEVQQEGPSIEKDNISEKQLVPAVVGNTTNGEFADAEVELMVEEMAEMMPEADAFTIETDDEVFYAISDISVGTTQTDTVPVQFNFDVSTVSTVAAKKVEMAKDVNVLSSRMMDAREKFSVEKSSEDKENEILLLTTLF